MKKYSEEALVELGQIMAGVTPLMWSSSFWKWVGTYEHPSVIAKLVNAGIVAARGEEGGEKISALAAQYVVTLANAAWGDQAQLMMAMNSRVMATMHEHLVARLRGNEMLLMLSTKVPSRWSDDGFVGEK